jgi:hypothetical protein
MGLLSLIRQPDYLSFKANPRGSEGGTTIYLTSSDNRIQTFNLSSAAICVLPSANILAGDKWEIINRSTFLLTIQTSDGTILAKILAGQYATVSLIATPTTGTNWQKVSDTGEFKFQTKIQPNSQLTTPQTVFTFNNLIIGKRYRMFGHFSWNIYNNTGEIQFKDGSNIFYDGQTTGTTSASYSIEGHAIRTATTTSFTVYLAVANGNCNLQGSGSFTNGTWVTLEELPYHQETTDWT